MRSLSNLIKANYIHYSQEEKKVIDSDRRIGNFQTLSPARVEEIAHEEAYPEENPSEEAVGEGQPEIPPDIEEQNRELLKEAMEQAEAVKREAEAEAIAIKKEAYESGRQEGYEAGVREAEAELSRHREQLGQEQELLKRQYEEAISSLEPEFVSLLIAYIEKLTGILCEDKREVILHLVSGAMRNLERSRQFLIRVSPDDYPVLEQAKDTLHEITGKKAAIEIIEDSSLGKNQCMIETDDRIIDCGLDEQLKGLKEDLKLLARI